MVRNTRGFTLIEAVIYIALLSFLMVGAVATSYQLVGSSTSLSAKNTTGGEGEFVLHKLDWALSGVRTISTPSSWSNALRLSRYDGVTVDMCLNNQAIWMRENQTGGICADTSYTAITTSNVTASSLSFHYVPASGGAPAGLEASTTINGMVFYTKRYIRK